MKLTCNGHKEWRVFYAINEKELQKLVGKRVIILKRTPNEDKELYYGKKGTISGVHEYTGISIKTDIPFYVEHDLGKIKNWSMNTYTLNDIHITEEK